VIDPTSQLSAEIVEDEASFAALEDERYGLFACASPKMPFLRFNWLRLCWQRQQIERIDLMTGEGFGKERLADHVAVVLDRRVRLF
jgi:hypothetical protein